MEEEHRDEEAYRQSLFEMQTHTRLYDEIFDFDHLYEDEDEDVEERFIDNQYYIGLPVLETHNIYSYQDYLLFASYVKINTFYKYPYQDIVKYLNSLRCIGPYKMIQPEVMKMKFVKSEYNWPVYTVIVKTFWIKLIQRTWKKRYHEYQNNLKKNMPKIMRDREMGKRIPQLTIVGMLSYLKDNK
tara:strand:- start:7 stop:561 length:555 start_codon:yes stop_codon:yes gene_type:complete